MKILPFYKLHFRSLKNPIIIILFIGVTIRLLLFIFYHPWNIETEQTRVILSDAEFYHKLALCIYNDFSFCGNTLRVPGYPAFIALIYFITGVNTWVVLFIQVFISTLTIYLTYKIAQLAINKKIALLAALLVALDPHQIIYSQYLFADTLFTFIFTLIVFLFIHGVYNKQVKYIIISGFLTGIGILVKPVILYFPVIVVIYIILLRYKLLLKLKYATLYIVFCCISLSPWLIRNYSGHQVFGISTIQGNAILNYYAAYTSMRNTGKTYTQTIAEFQNQLKKNSEYASLNPFEKARLKRKVGINFLKDNKSTFIKLYLSGIVKMYITPAAHDVGNTFGLKTAKLEQYYNFSLKNSVKLFLENRNNLILYISCTIVLFMIFCYAFAIVGTLKKSKIQNPFFSQFLLFSISTVIYFSLITGLLGHARYKLPITPIILIFSAIGIDYFLQDLMKTVKTVWYKKLLT